MPDADDAPADGPSASVTPIRRPARRNWLAQWPITLVLVGVAIALAMIGADYFRRGSVVLSASVLLAESSELAPYQEPELDIVTYLPRRRAMSQVDAVSQEVFVRAADAPPTEQVHVATYATTHEALSARGHDLVSDLDRARILRSVVMKPESESLVPAIHARLESLAHDVDAT